MPKVLSEAPYEQICKNIKDNDKLVQLFNDPDFSRAFNDEQSHEGNRLFKVLQMIEGRPAVTRAFLEMLFDSESPFYGIGYSDKKKDSRYFIKLFAMIRQNKIPEEFFFIIKNAILHDKKLLDLLAYSSDQTERPCGNALTIFLNLFDSYRKVHDKDYGYVWDNSELIERLGYSQGLVDGLNVQMHLVNIMRVSGGLHNCLALLNKLFFDEAIMLWDVLLCRLGEPSCSYLNLLCQDLQEKISDSEIADKFLYYAILLIMHSPKHGLRFFEQEDINVVNAIFATSKKFKDFIIEFQKVFSEGNFMKLCRSDDDGFDIDNLDISESSCETVELNDELQWSANLFSPLDSEQSLVVRDDVHDEVGDGYRLTETGYSHQLKQYIASVEELPNIVCEFYQAVSSVGCKNADIQKTVADILEKQPELRKKAAFTL